jgi:hypothetical protein
LLFEEKTKTLSLDFDPILSLDLITSASYDLDSTLCLDIPIPLFDLEEDFLLFRPVLFLLSGLRWSVPN